MKNYICDDSENSEESKDWIPDPDVLCPLWNWSLRVFDVFRCVNSDFKNVVQESEERGQWERAREENCEAELDCKLDIV